MLTAVKRGFEATDQINFVLETCCSCGVPFFMPSYFKRQKLDDQTLFYCPNGHPQHYVGKTEAQKLKEQLDKLQQEKQRSEEELQNRWLDVLNEKTKIEKQLKRVHKGVCPCCNRTFINLQRHMKTKHPDVAK